MSSKMKKVIAVVVSILIIGIVISIKNSNDEVVEVINTTLNDKDNLVYPDSSNTNTFYFIVEMEGVSVEDLITEFEFDQEVSYEVFYENIKERSSLPIEYYLAAETKFNFGDIEEFNKYSSDRKVKEEFAENEVYEKYIKDYREDKNYRQYKKGAGIYMFELKVSNASDNTILKKATFSVEDENENRRVVYEQNTNVKYVKTSNSNNAYSASFNKYEYGKYYNGNMKFDFELKCNQNINLSDYKTQVQGYEVASVNVYKSGELVENPSCIANETVNVEIAIKIKNNTHFNDSVSINFTSDNSNVTVNTPQIFSPDNVLFINEANLDKYSSYYKYKYNLK